MQCRSLSFFIYIYDVIRYISVPNAMLLVGYRFALRMATKRTCHAPTFSVYLMMEIIVAI